VKKIKMLYYGGLLMDYTVKHLEYKLKATLKTIKMYLCRAEFSHIKQEVRKVRSQEIKYITNVTDYDLIRLEQLITNRRTKSRRLNPQIKKEITLEEAKKVLRKIRKILKTDKNDVFKNIEIENELYKVEKYI
jgi:hypothetical protein